MKTKAHYARVAAKNARREARWKAAWAANPRVFEKAQHTIGAAVPYLPLVTFVALPLFF